MADGGPRYGILKGNLVRESKFFQVALDGTFAETSTGVIRVPAEEAKHVQMFESWLHTGYFGGSLHADRAMVASQLIDLYIWADSKLLKRMRRVITDMLVDVSGRQPLMRRHVERVYDNLPGTSPMHLLIVDWFLGSGWLPGDARIALKKWDVPDFSADVAVRAMEHLPTSSWSNRSFEEQVVGPYVSPGGHGKETYHHHQADPVNTLFGDDGSLDEDAGHDVSGPGLEDRHVENAEGSGWQQERTNHVQ